MFLNVLYDGMGKASQLSQLKSALSSAGLSRQSQPGLKKRKRGGDGTASEKAKKAAKLEAIQRRLNPFDDKVTRLKHDVGGRKLKGVVGRPGASKQAGLEQVRSCFVRIHFRRLIVFPAQENFAR